MIVSAWKRLTGSFYGWRMIALGSMIRILGGGLHLYGFTVFFLPLSQDLGINRAATSLAFSLARAEGAIEGPFAGYLIDRFGPRPVMIVGILMSGVGYMLFSGVHTYPAFMVVYLGVISLSFSAGFMHSPMVLANSWFIRRRALAMTLISASVGMGGALVSPLLAGAVQLWGWRTAAFVAGLLLLVLGLPLAALVRRSPESMGLVPDGLGGATRSGRGSESTQRPPIEEPEFTVRQAMRTAAFWMLVLATTFRVAGLSAMMVHFVPIMVWKGLTEQQAALLLGTLALLSLPSHLTFGWLADRMDRPRLMAAGMLVVTFAMIVLIYGEATGFFWLFVVLFTVVEALFPVTWATVGDFFGRKSFATIRGSMSFFYHWGAVAAPVLAGYIYDRSQSYIGMLWIMAGLFLTAALFYALLPKPKSW